ncbi:acyl carrier protein [Maritimibacter sp. DP1N21-5]|uniref:acyl carrier protein n=1 Tax=Maritimibacter sp. DP1N21-5 TaxID=2836867 RepID=UPI001C447DCF|nr:acyl carrier protein [Maritimibacter sp. DP1N21-5]MBV7409694.1 acyl carrier protein [Maritimibacter sp. DP1N21-5]
MTNTIEHTIIDILARQAVLEPSEIALEHRLDALGIDSLGMVETIFAIEETFDISVPFNANEPGAGGLDLSTVAALVAAVRGLLSEPAA